jgi:hypothetical protein
VLFVLSAELGGSPPSSIPWSLKYGMGLSRNALVPLPRRS